MENPFLRIPALHQALLATQENNLKRSQKVSRLCNGLEQEYVAGHSGICRTLREMYTLRDLSFMKLRTLFSAVFLLGNLYLASPRRRVSSEDPWRLLLAMVTTREEGVLGIDCRE